MKKNLHNKNLTKMLGRYGATALAAAAVGPVANGQIVHTPEVNDTIHLGDTLELDFNSDAISDVQFSISLNPRHVDKTWGDFIFTHAIATPGGKGIGATWYGGSFLNPLELDQVISADTSFTFLIDQPKVDPVVDTATMLTGMGLLSHMGWTTWDIYGWGFTAEDSSTYLGYEFRIDEEPYYGWVKVTFHRIDYYPGKNNYYGDNLYLVINEYAYETSGAPIKAGQSVGVEEQMIKGFNLYPNPATDRVTIRMEESSQYNVRVFDMTGKSLMNSKFDGQEYLMDISELKSGMYMLQISDGELSLSKKLLIK